MILSQAMHWLQPDEDGGQGEKMILKQVLATLDLQVMFAHMLRRHKLEALEELPVKPVLDKESFLTPIGFDKITLLQRT